MIINPAYPQAIRGAAIIHREVVVDDCYGLRRFTDLSSVYDIGANVGWFSVLARMLFPRATVTAFEPSPDTFTTLQENASYLHIATECVALGDGSPVRIRHGSMDGCNRTEPGGGVPSKPLRELLAGAVSPYFVKLDCEGAERYALADVDVLRNAAGWGMEYHSDLAGMPVADFCAQLPPHTCTPAGPLRWLIRSAR